MAVPSKALSMQIPFRYRNFDSPTGVTRNTAKLLAEKLGVDETQALHIALHELAVRILPQYEPDDGPLNATQIRQIKKIASVPEKQKSVRSSLFLDKAA
jgi:broad specificity phosphatase PhoE